MDLKKWYTRMELEHEEGVMRHFIQRQRSLKGVFSHYDIHFKLFSFLILQTQYPHLYVGSNEVNALLIHRSRVLENHVLRHSAASL